MFQISSNREECVEAASGSKQFQQLTNQRVRNVPKLELLANQQPEMFQFSGFVIGQNGLLKIQRWLPAGRDKYCI